MSAMATSAGQGPSPAGGINEALEVEQLRREAGNETAPGSKMFRGKGIFGLLWMNTAMAVFHAALFGVTLGLGNLGLSVPVYGLSNELLINEPGADGRRSWELLPEVRQEPVMRLRLTWMTAGFFFVSAFFHTGNSAFWRRLYLDGIADCRCPSRWVEYSFSASLMSVLIGYASGTNIMLVLVAIFFLTMTTMFFGHLTEELARPNQEHTAWLAPWHRRLQAHFLGYVPQIVAWALILTTFHETASAASLPDGRGMPKFVYGIVYGRCSSPPLLGLARFLFSR